MDQELKQLLERVGDKLDAFEKRLAAVEKAAHVQVTGDALAENIRQIVRSEVMHGRRSPNSARRALCEISETRFC